MANTDKRGMDVLNDPQINKSTGFTEAERQALGLVGLVPDLTESMELSWSASMLQLKEKATDLDRLHLPDQSARQRTRRCSTAR